MNAVATQPAVKPTEHSKLVAVTFVQPIQFGGVSTAVRVGITVDSVTPARLNPEGRPRPIVEDEVATGLLLRRQIRGPKGNQVVTQSFVPMANVAEMLFGE